MNNAERIKRYNNKIVKRAKSEKSEIVQRWPFNSTADCRVNINGPYVSNVTKWKFYMRQEGKKEQEGAEEMPSKTHASSTTNAKYPIDGAEEPIVVWGWKSIGNRIHLFLVNGQTTKWLELNIGPERTSNG